MRDLALVFALLALCSGCSTLETRYQSYQTAKLPDSVSPNAEWFYEEDLVVDGRFGLGESCLDKTFEITQGPGILKHDQQVLETTNGHWEFNHFTDQKIQWHVCAGNCAPTIGGCGKVRLHIQYGLVGASLVDTKAVK